jgi:hypothetical protein
MTGASSVRLRANVDPSKDVLTWAWKKGAFTSLVDFGNPTATTSYAFCLYDSTPRLVMSARAPAGGLCGNGPCWKPMTLGFRYSKKAQTPDGLYQIILKPGMDGKPKITVKGRGVNLALPPLPLTQDPTVVVQLKNNAGVCWEADYSAPAIRNTSTQFKAKSN